MKGDKKMAKQTPLDDMIDLALDMRDFEWLKELSEIKHNTSNSALVADDLFDEFGILEDCMVKRIDRITPEVIQHSVIVKVDKFRAKSGSTVKYTVLNINERYCLFGYYAGINGISSSFIGGQVKND